MRKHVFLLIWAAIAITLATLSFYYKDGTEAMVAQVETRTTAISFLKPVIIKQIKALPGQSVKKGDILVEVERPDLQLDIDQVLTDIQLKQLELAQKEIRFEQQRKELTLNRDVELSKLSAELHTLELESINADDIRSKLGVGKSLSDSIRVLQVNNLKSEQLFQRQSTQNALQSISDAFDAEKKLLNEQINLLRKKYDLIQSETKNMTQVALYDGIVASVDAREGELVSPFTKVLSIFESSPTLIKAFMNERINYEVFVGQRVIVESENRLYKLDGVVIELGARITSYPLKLEPIRDQISYGREVFVEISASSQFLNGEKVFVYPADQ